MLKRLIIRGRKIITGPQSSILSAATIIMLMIVFARILGLIRQRTLAHFFTPEEISVFFAAFRIPDTVFEILVFGTFSSAFIPVFTKLYDKNEKEAWLLASRITNIGLLIFVFFAVLLSVFSHGLYSILAPGYTGIDRENIIGLSRILFVAQGFFVLSYVLTGVLESLRRFLIPALAPIFYNLGIILGIILLSDNFGIKAPAIGVFMGAGLHFLIQLPLSIKLGYKVTNSIKIDNNVRRVGKLAGPRVVEIIFNQIVKTVELYLASFVSLASYAYYYLGNSIQLIPVSLFGTSIAKAALPTLSRSSHDMERFRKSLWSSLNQIIYLVLPLATILIVLRIPIVRLIYGTEIFDWESTVQTGLVVSSFGVGTVFQAANSLLARAFYALDDTKTPVKVSILSICLIVALDYFLLQVMGFQVWGLAASYSVGSFFQFLILLTLIRKKTNQKSFSDVVIPAAKAFYASLSSGLIMFLVLKIFDRAVWVKRLSFLGKLEATNNIPFELFVLDTRYTVNLLILTLFVIVVGMFMYILISLIMGLSEVWTIINLVRKIFTKKKIEPIPEENEPVSPAAQDDVK